MYFRVFVLTLLLLSLSGCLNQLDVASEIPMVWYEDFRTEDLTLVVGFIDGDGDVGWNNGYSGNDTVNNFFMDFFKIVNGDTIQHEYPDSVISNIIIEELDQPQGNNKTLKGSIEVFLTYWLIGTDIDSFYIRFYMLDRKFHESNRDSTPLIVIDPRFLYP